MHLLTARGIRLPVRYLLVSGLLAGWSLSAQTSSGTVQGSVVDYGGRPIAGARVFISQALPAGVSRISGPPVITGPQVALTMTDEKGLFVAANLHAGNYVACAQTLTPGLLDPCHWAASAPIFTVTAGQATSAVKVAMAKGAVISIHVNDPLNLLSTSAGAIDMACRFQIVTARGHHYDALITNRKSGTRDHLVTVPFGAPLNVLALCPFLELDDDSGKPAAITGRSIIVPDGSSPAALTYTVRGAKR